MKHKTAFTKKDLVAALLCLVFLLANLAAVGAGGRKRAKQAVCLSNLRQWANIFASYLDDHEGYFWWGTDWNKWMIVLKRYGAGEDYDFWCCPMANKPRNDMQGNAIRPYGTLTAWGHFNPSNPERPDRGTYGSYGLNNWVVNPQWPDTFQRGQQPVKNCWRSVNVKGADNIPLFLDSKNKSVFPRSQDEPPQTPEGQAASGEMKRVCINRHNGAINGLFLDLSARRVPIKCLWNFKWHRYFDIYAIDPKNYAWPLWMDKFEDDCE